MTWTLSTDELAKIVGGEVLSDSGKTCQGLGTDTRQELEGQLFIALKGDSFDGHNFLVQATEKGAATLLIESRPNQPQLKASQAYSIVQVPDTLQALQILAHWWRKKCGWKVLAITGSSGKTTTKNILRDILKTEMNIYTSEKNFNNHWGVPFTLLSAPADVQVVITEMGMNHLGEIKRLCEIAQPDAVVCTMVGQAHIGNLGSLENVAQAKEEIYLNSLSATQVFNIDNASTIFMQEKAEQRNQERIITFSNHREGADIRLRVTDMGIDSIRLAGTILGVDGEAELPLFGRHNVINVMSAVGLASATGLSSHKIWEGMKFVEKSAWGRNQKVSLKSGATVLFDGYNANPESMAVLIRNLFEIYIEGKKIAVLGDMFELGDKSDEAHEALGEMVGNTDYDIVWFIGEQAPQFEAGLKMSGFSKTYFISTTYEEELALKIASMLEQQDIVVVKGSRGMKLERAIQAWDPVDFNLSQ